MTAGVHTCQTGPGTGQSFFNETNAWSCPLCGELGPDVTPEQHAQRNADFQGFVFGLLDEELARRIAEMEGA